MLVSDGTGLKEMVADEVGKQVDVTDMLGDGAIENSVYGDDIGASIGRRFGERIGRQLGSSIGREVHVTIVDGIEEGNDLGEITTELTTGVRDAFRTSLEDLEGRESVASVARSVRDGGTLEDLADGIGADESGADEESESESESRARSEAEATGDEDEDDADAEASGGESDEAQEHDDGRENGALETADRSVDDLAELRRDTLEDFLGVLSYDDLQSVAKDVDVTANLSREEMTDEIIDTVTTGEEAADSKADAKAE